MLELAKTLGSEHIVTEELKNWFYMDDKLPRPLQVRALTTRAGQKWFGTNKSNSFIQDL